MNDPDPATAVIKSRRSIIWRVEAGDGKTIIHCIIPDTGAKVRIDGSKNLLPPTPSPSCLTE